MLLQQRLQQLSAHLEDTMTRFRDDPQYAWTYLLHLSGISDHEEGSRHSRRRNLSVNCYGKDSPAAAAVALAVAVRC